MKRRSGRNKNIINDLIEIEKLFRELKILEERNYFPEREISFAHFRQLSYLKNWSEAIRLNMFDFILVDNSLLIFDKLGNSYRYLECPYICDNYIDFCYNNGLELSNGEDYFDFYETYLEQCESKESFMQIRYDYDVDSYKPGSHPASHLHFGYGSDMRIGIDKILTPMAFTLFVIRQSYGKQWLLFLEYQEWIKKYRKHKKSLEKVNDKFWNDLDTFELFFS